MNWLRPLREVVADARAVLFAATTIVLIAFLGELLQHVAEIQLGMFATREAFVTLQGSFGRLAFGVIKVSALLVTVAWSARWLAARHRDTRPGLDGQTDWLRLIVLSGLSVAALLLVLLAPISNGRVRIAALALVVVASMPASRLAMDALFGQPRQTWRQAVRRRPMPALIDMIAVLPVPLLMFLHFKNHSLAFGAPPATVWALMVWDAALVAVLAVLLGALTYRSYRPPPA